MQVFDVAIIGAGHAGAQAASLLRQRGFAGTLGILGDEPELPYERPPLSKDYLAGEKPFERLLLRAEDFWRNHDIELLRGTRIDRVDVQARRLYAGSGECFGYGNLIWAAGGSPRPLTCPGHELAGIHYVRTRQDVDRLRAELDHTRQVVVIGGGYIGLETAAVLQQLGRSVTLLEVQNRVLARVAGESLSRFYEAEHRARGVDVRLSTRVDRIIGEAGRVIGVALADGTLLPAEMVVVGIGIEPSVAPLAEAGLTQAAGGVLVDEYCRSSAANIFAIGDCAAHRNCHSALDGPIRLESVQNANDQARVVADSLTGKPQPYTALPWFWSDQYDLKLQTVGLSAGHDQTVMRGDPANRSFSLVYLRQGRVLAVDSVNLARDFVQAKALVQAGATVDVEALADASTSLRAALKPA
ncbi:NAD(P)/FAD-dependent oxidoreductase [Halopseudomonas bauzanensis]|uniref:3-phenylpropionate/trans-cinnamate dioxygenase ferredoxin reductase subunit n=1 Tax=Halopseudomonas bauzanensis TaxID=653930 RepID=A0A1I4MLQ9_9GAMM|nr:FAD-dependent oxidoreductase [Halopseudomonas bauzanensis]SES03174.1 3-phenylpropionate/trans-cinnamate dioxygenase ferredoxin reductase subunit [Halopseudomonas bauzanensis]SFM03987.1 3-phenylpropionate/trans-cinnamate dioxygenase ferredoxin reductase subunit [Halopseudomonas bauzanensis]